MSLLPTSEIFEEQDMIRGHLLGLVEHECAFSEIGVGEDGSHEEYPESSLFHIINS